MRLFHWNPKIKRKKCKHKSANWEKSLMSRCESTFDMGKLLLRAGGNLQGKKLSYWFLCNPSPRSYTQHLPGNMIVLRRPINCLFKSMPAKNNRSSPTIKMSEEVGKECKGSANWEGLGVWRPVRSVDWGPSKIWRQHFHRIFQRFKQQDRVSGRSKWWMDYVHPETTRYCSSVRPRQIRLYLFSGGCHDGPANAPWASHPLEPRWLISAEHFVKVCSLEVLIIIRFEVNAKEMWMVAELHLHSTTTKVYFANKKPELDRGDFVVLYSFGNMMNQLLAVKNS